MNDLEIPLGKRKLKYRLFEMLPATLSYGAIILMVVLSFWRPFYAAAYLLLIITSMLVKAVGIAFHTYKGFQAMKKANKVDWAKRLKDLANPAESLSRLEKASPKAKKEFHYSKHVQNLKDIIAEPTEYPAVSDIYHVAIVPTYNEPYDVTMPTIEAIKNTTTDNSKIIVAIAYEERGGTDVEETSKRIQKEFAGVFADFYIIKHPTNLPNEIIGKGGNITFAGKFIAKELEKQKKPFDDVIVTTLDSDNKPHPAYFDSVAYEFVVHKDRQRLSYQPLALFLNNIWDVPAPMRVIATGNSFWNIICSMRPHMIRNFAAHAQPLKALAEMDFWSTRTIVEDGHQYWRSYFHFKGDYSVLPIHIPVYQDAVLSKGYLRTFKAQFMQLRRWSYGASDIPYIGVRVFTTKPQAPFWPGFARFIRLLDGHVTLASVAILITFGGWIPLLVNSSAARSVAAHQLPEIISRVQTFAMIGLLITITLSFQMIPKRPPQYKRRRSLYMLLQWFLMPVTSVFFGSLAALSSQGRLFLGRYLDKFEVTEKAIANKKKRKSFWRKK